MYYICSLFIKHVDKYLKIWYEKIFSTLNKTSAIIYSILRIYLIKFDLSGNEK